MEKTEKFPMRMYSKKTATNIYAHARRKKKHRGCESTIESKT